MTVMTSREFNQDAGAAKRAAMHGPVFITDRGRPAHVLLSIEEYNKLTSGKNITDMLACADAADIDFTPATLRSLLNPAGFD